MTNANTSYTVTNPKGFTFEVYTDGSGFTSTINVGGDVYAVNYTNKANVTLTNGKSGTKPRRWTANWTRKIAEEFAATLPAEWQAMNRAMYDS